MYEHALKTKAYQGVNKNTSHRKIELDLVVPGIPSSRAKSVTIISHWLRLRSGTYGTSYFPPLAQVSRIAPQQYRGQYDRVGNVNTSISSANYRIVHYEVK